MSVRRVLTSPWLVATLVGAAVWINVPSLRTAATALLRSTTEATAGEGITDDGGDDTDGALTDARTGDRSTFVPAVGFDDLPDPFDHAAVAAAAVDSAPAGANQSGVQMVLRKAHVRRAIVDGAIVGEGDRTSRGVVREIRADGVVFATATNDALLIPLAATSNRPAPAPDQEQPR